MLLLIDNYDSFTWNLVQYLGDLGAPVEVQRNDQLSVDQALALAPKAIVISPGPCDPDRAGICLPLIKAAVGKIPLLGVCLGHQAIGQAFGGKVIRAPLPMHGKMDMIHHTGEDLFRNVPSPFKATRYHSLIVERQSLPDCLKITGETADGLIMALSHKTHPIFGVQFHPESIASEHGHDLLANFLSLSGIPVQKKAA
ncbi:MAG: aminodeoxychorismate/anthranilate synthase component II [Alphaproteobacteria bacterium]|nr:aminodeoxychorismate/anthranilate synthase component II [Alphaproteobacteria bacterium]